MTDRFSKSKRSEIMGRISNKDTKPELVVRSFLHRYGYRFRLHRKDLPGKPDICLPKFKVVIFVHGCYWHRHQDCKKGQDLPATNKAFWKEKFARTFKRDLQNRRDLEDRGWKVLTIWECETRNQNLLEERLLKKLRRIIG